MEISGELFETFLQCPTKCWLRAQGETGAENTYAQWVKGRSEAFRQEGLRRLQKARTVEELAVSPPLESVKTAKWRLGMRLTARVLWDTRSHGSSSTPQMQACVYEPVTEPTGGREAAPAFRASEGPINGLMFHHAPPLRRVKSWASLVH